MQELFQQLQQLQDVLSNKYQIEKDLESLPQKLTTKEGVLNRLHHVRDNLQSRLNEEKTSLHRIRIEVEEVEKRREMLEERMNEIKTQREYEALDKEITEAAQNEQKLRRQVQYHESQLKELDGEYQRNNDLILAQEEEFKSEKKKLKAMQQQQQKSFKQLEIQEKQLSEGLDSELLFKFDRILRKKEGLGIVPLSRGICSGCHMILPAQFVGDVRTGEQVHFCPYCSRILYFLDDSDSTDVIEFEDEEIGALSDVFDYNEDGDFEEFSDD